MADPADEQPCTDRWDVASLRSELEHLANYVWACLNARHDEEGGDDCVRCKSDRRELQRLSLEKFWDGERFVLRTRRDATS